MQLIVLGSGSKGNCYLLKSSTGRYLIMDCGVRINTILDSIEHAVRQVDGCIVTHEHKDHSLSIGLLSKYGIDVYSGAGTFVRMKLSGHRLRALMPLVPKIIGEFTVIGFPVEHDAAEPMGFLVYHPECGNLLFVTDTQYIDQKFRDLETIIVEANYGEEMLGGPMFLQKRIAMSHMSLETMKQWVLHNDLTKVRTIVLAHLSDRNSHAVEFKKEIESHTGKRTYIADAGMCINI